MTSGKTQVRIGGAGDQPGKLGGSVIPSLTPANEKMLHKYLNFCEPQFSHLWGSKITANDLLESSQLQISPNYKETLKNPLMNEKVTKRF